MAHNYLEKIAKYKKKCSYVKNIMTGGTFGTLKIMYANVGRDYDTTSSRYTYRNVANCDKYDTPEITLYQMKICIDEMAKIENIDMFMFCEFCATELENLMIYMNKIPSYGIFVMAQNRDFQLYPVEGTIDRKIHRFYEPEKKHGDSFYKYFGFIYNKDKLEFMIKETNDIIINNCYEVVNKFTIIPDKIKKNIIEKIEIVPNIIAHEVNRFTYSPNKDDKRNISACIGQYCGAAIFKNIKTNSTVGFFVPHFMSQLTYDYQDFLWRKQYINLKHIVDTLNYPHFIIGDFNFGYYQGRYYDFRDMPRECIRFADITGSTNNTGHIIRAKNAEGIASIPQVHISEDKSLPYSSHNITVLTVMDVKHEVAESLIPEPSVVVRNPESQISSMLTEAMKLDITSYISYISSLRDDIPSTEKNLFRDRIEFESTKKRNMVMINKDNDFVQNEKNTSKKYKDVINEYIKKYNKLTGSNRNNI